MNKMLYIVIGIIIISLLFYLFGNKEGEEKHDIIYESTASQSHDRIVKLGLQNSTQVVSGILDETKLNIPKIKENNNKKEYRADSSRQWILNLLLPKDEIISQDELYELFDLEWRTKFTSTIFGYSPEENRWTYALAGGAPTHYNKVQIAIDLLDVFSEASPDYDDKKLERYVTELEKRLKNKALKYNVQELESKKSAIEKSKKLVKLNLLFDKEIVISLQSKNQYDGREVWNVLQNLGLKWGDGDLFHWNNSSQYASDEHFSVWTSTSPGYFLPEHVIQGKMNPTNIVFGFSIPRSADPINIYQVVINSINYCQEKLGGKIMNKEGKPFEEVLERKELEVLVKEMIDNDVIPGSDNALMLY